MRVLMLGWEFPPFVTGGLGAACRGITAGLAGIGVEVLFVAPRSAGQAERHGARVVGCDELAGEPRLALVRAGHEPRGKLDVLGVASWLRPYMRPARRAGNEGQPAAPARFTGGYGPDLFGEVRRYADVVLSLAASEPFDLIHAHDWMTFHAARELRAQSGRPLVCHVHACERDRAGDDADPRILAAEADGLAAADRVVCVSRYTAARLGEDYAVPSAKLRVVHNAIDVPRRAPREAGRGGRTVLFLGRVTAQKGPRHFLEAAARVARAEPQARFVVAGTGDELPAMVERAAELGLGPSVRFTGYLEEQDVERVWARADLFVLSSVSEPFGLTPLEALAHGVPAIVTRQSGVAEVLASAPKYDWWDVEALADKILTLLRDSSLRRQLAAAGRLELEGLCWERRAEALLDVYRELSSA